MAEKPFELRVVPEGPSDYWLALYEMPARSRNLQGNSQQWQQVVRVRGIPMRAIIDQVLATIKQAGYRASDLSRSRKAPFQLAEEPGVRIGLLMLGVKPLRKTSRMTDISEQIRSMTDEEAYYWFSKTTDANHGRRCRKAMRILLAQE